MMFVNKREFVNKFKINKIYSEAKSFVYRNKLMLIHKLIFFWRVNIKFNTKTAYQNDEKLKKSFNMVIPLLKKELRKVII